MGFLNDDETFIVDPAHVPPPPPPPATRAPQHLSVAATCLVLAVKLLGYAVFRGANSQKDMFRANPSDPRVAHLRTLKTERGTQLIISGWWGTARHINYFGDWIMG